MILKSPDNSRGILHTVSSSYIKSYKLKPKLTKIN